VHAQNSDIFDVLSYIAYHRDIMPRLERASKAELRLIGYDKAKQVFLNFVLKQYVDEGVKELDDTRLKNLLELKYNSIHDAKEVLGDIKSIREAFIGFQKYLYEVG
ncbi:MAG: restriction endonuclease subunit R, partial [Sulfurovum sp.]